MMEGKFPVHVWQNSLFTSYNEESSVHESRESLWCTYFLSIQIQKLADKATLTPVLEYALIYVKAHTYYSVHVLSVHVCEEMHRLKSHHRQLDQKATLYWCCLMVNCPPHRDNSYPVWDSQTSFIVL